VIPVMNIGKLNQYGTIQRPSDVDDDAGGKVRTWVDDATRVPMGIEPLQGDERMYGMQLQTRVTHQITMRYREGMTTAKRIVCRGVAYNVRYVGDKDLRNTMFVLLAEQGVAS
jgi:SPP1 family predicted phage head-tail adaptor